MIQIPKDCEEDWGRCTEEERHIVIRTGLQCIKVAKEAMESDQVNSLRVSYERELSTLKVTVQSLEDQKENLKKSVDEQTQFLRSMFENRENEFKKQLESLKQKNYDEAMELTRQREEPLKEQIESLKQQLRDIQESTARPLREQIESQKQQLETTVEQTSRPLREQIELLKKQLEDSKSQMQQSMNEQTIQLRSMYEKRENELKNQLETLEQKNYNEAMELVRQREEPLKEQIESLKQQLRDTSESIARPLREQIESLKQQLETTVEQTSRPLREQIEFLKKQLEETKQRTTSLTENLTKQMEKNAMFSKSTRRGEAGQNDIETILQSSFLSQEGWLIEDTSTKGGMGDIQVTPPSTSKVGSVLIEIKNYSHSVPKMEIAKFKRDVIQSDVGSGIFISLVSGIHNISNRTIEMVMDKDNNNKPLLYLVGKDERDILAQWVLIMSKITMDLHSKMVSALDQKNTITVQDVQSKVTQIHSKIEPITNQIQCLKQSFNDNIKSLDRCVLALLNQVNEIGGEYGLIRQEKSYMSHIEAWRSMIEDRIFMAKEMEEFLLSRGLSKNRAVSLRKELTERCNMKEDPYKSKVGTDYQVGKAYYKMKTLIQ